MAMLNHLLFDPVDNPMQFSKVGNWLITFLSPPEDLNDSCLALTYILPRQLSPRLQPQRIIIHRTANAHLWAIDYVECYDSQQQSTLSFAPHTAEAQCILNTLIQELNKYDVDVQLCADLTNEKSI